MKDIKKIKNIIEKSFIYFVSLQVLIDLMTTFFVNKLNILISFGMITRTIFIFLIIIYIFMFLNKKSKIITLFLIGLITYQLIYVLKIDDVNFFENFRYYLRVMYYPIVFLFSINYINKDNKTKIINIMNFNVFLIGLVFLFSFIFNNALPMYNGDRIGISAWFLSGNEISSIISILAFIPIYCFIKKQTIFNYLVILLEILVLILLGTKSSLLILSCCVVYFLIILIIETKKKTINVAYLTLWIILIIAISIFFKKIPAIYNINYQKQLQILINEKRSFSDEKEIPEYTKEKRYLNEKAIDYNNYIAEINITDTIDEKENVFFYISGYFYPLYFDVSHPKYIEKNLIFKSKNNKVVVHLNDEYNRYVDEFVNDDYNSDFSGLTATVNIENFILKEKYSIFMEIKIDGITKIYTLNNNNIIFNNNKIIDFSYENENLYINNKIINKNSVKNLLLCYFENKYKYNFLLSGRVEDVIEFVSCKNYYNTYNIFLGSGYIGNLVDENGFEMEFIEIFITFGIFGFIIYFICTFIVVIKILKELIKRKILLLLRKDIFCFTISISLAFILSFFVGHMLLTPSSSIYFAIILQIFYLNIKEE